MNECNLKRAHTVSAFARALINPCLCNKPVDVRAALQVDGVCATPSTLTSALMQTAASRHLQPRQEVSRRRPSSRLCISLHQHVLESAHIRLYQQPAGLYWCVEKERKKKKLQKTVPRLPVGPELLFVTRTLWTFSLQFLPQDPICQYTSQFIISWR